MPITANQLVAANLRRARDVRGLTQEQAAERLEPYLGTRWSPAVFSAAETSVKTSRVREFDASELLAFSRAFDLPIGWFFLPAETDGFPNLSCGGERELTTGELLDAVYPYGGSPDVAMRMTETLRRLPKALRSKADQGALAWTMERMRAAVTAVSGEFLALSRDMHSAADRLEQVHAAGLQAAAEELDEQAAPVGVARKDD
jgi:hypothetical protein